MPLPLPLIYLDGKFAAVAAAHLRYINAKHALLSAIPDDLSERDTEILVGERRDAEASFEQAYRALAVQWDIAKSHMNPPKPGDLIMGGCDSHSRAYPCPLCAEEARR